MKRSRRNLSLPLLGAWALFLPQMCSGNKDAANDPAPPVVDSTPVPVPPVAMSGDPVGSFVDAAVPETPFDQAQSYEAGGQRWLARLVLEPKALGPDGTKSELQLLAFICHEQGDDACVDKCAAKLGVKKLKFDGGAPKTNTVDVSEHREPETDLAQARLLYLKHKDQDARDLLEPKVLDGKASKEETRLLRAICNDQGDRMCVALCDSKLK